MKNVKGEAQAKDEKWQIFSTKTTFDGIMDWYWLQNDSICKTKLNFSFVFSVISFFWNKKETWLLEERADVKHISPWFHMGTQFPISVFGGKFFFLLILLAKSLARMAFIIIIMHIRWCSWSLFLLVFSFSGTADY